MLAIIERENLRNYTNNNKKFCWINPRKIMKSKIQQLLKEAARQARSSETGESSTATASRAFSDVSDAEKLFDDLRQKLFRVRNWNAESAMMGFELFDENGNICDRESAVVGDFIRLSMVGGGKYDWVKIIEIMDEANEAVVTVKPSYNPIENEPDRNKTSHFFTDDSTNNFCLERNDGSVNFYVIGLSEKTNTDETENFIETIRNVAVANIGSYFGIQKAEWKTFCENFLK